jgi:hypothetical protein
MSLRPLGDALSEILTAAHGGAAPESVRVTRMDLDLPLDLVLAPGSSVLYGDVPRWRWQSENEPPCARLRVTYAEPGA